MNTAYKRTYNEDSKSSGSGPGHQSRSSFKPDLKSAMEEANERLRIAESNCEQAEERVRLAQSECEKVERQCKLLRAELRDTGMTDEQIDQLGLAQKIADEMPSTKSVPAKEGA